MRDVRPLPWVRVTRSCTGGGDPLLRQNLPGPSCSLPQFPSSGLKTRNSCLDCGSRHCLCALDHQLHRGKDFCLELCLAPSRCSAKLYGMNGEALPTPASFVIIRGPGAQLLPIGQQCGICHGWPCHRGPVTCSPEPRLHGGTRGHCCGGVQFILGGSRDRVGGGGPVSGLPPSH